jgi:hypothetical protein
MRLDTLMAPLSASRAALVPYIETIQDGATTAAQGLSVRAHDLSAKAHDLARHPPKAAKWLGNRYVLISLAAGACIFAARRLQLWRRRHPAKSRSRAAAQSRSRSAPRKTSRAGNRSARVH